MNVRRYFEAVTLTADEYMSVIERASAEGIAGGAIYDGLLLACAEKAKVQRIYTFNLVDFRRVAPHLAKLIVAP